jgi:aminoglycoside phosphotransferase (APT) family kinase protein
VAKLLGELVARGTRSAIHAYGAGVVVKVPHPETPTEWIESEAEYAEAARAVGAPVPRLFGIEQIGGRAASVWQRVEGISLWQRVVDHPATSAETGRQLAEVQLALFELVPPVTLPDQRDRVVSKIRSAAATLNESLARALELVPPARQPNRLCHGDLHPSNVILSDDGPMIVDWFDASRGEPIADVARTLVTLLGDGAAAPRHLPGSSAPTLATLTDSYLARLSDTLALDDAELFQWQAIQAVARMAEGVPNQPLLELWSQFERGNGNAPVAQAAAN